MTSMSVGKLGRFAILDTDGRGTLARTCTMLPALPLEVWEMIFDLLPGRVL